MALYAFDGTGDRWDQKSPITPTAKTPRDRYLTNVVLFYQEYLNAGLPAAYFPGVGSSISWMDRFLGTTLGFGALGVVRRAFNKLKQNIRNGDPVIDIIGYSRGAAIARIFADRTFRDYKKLRDANGRPLTQPPTIRFIGLFDTVASFGNPLNDNELFFQERIPRTAQHTFHAMALDVNRLGFGLDRAYGENVLEVWFRGGHGDIGGNSGLDDGKVPNRARTNIALTFMLKKAQEVAGIELNVNFDRYPMDIKAPVVIKANDPGVDPSRQYHDHDIFHYSLFDENQIEVTYPGCVNIPDYDQVVIEAPANEAEVSEKRIIHLTPQLAAKYPNTQSIYRKLHG